MGREQRAAERYRHGQKQPGCFGGVLQFLDFHRRLRSAHPRDEHRLSADPSFCSSQRPEQQRDSVEGGEIIIPRRSSVEDRNPRSPRHAAITTGKQVVDDVAIHEKKKKDASESETPRTPSVVARLMGLDHLPETPRHSSSQPAATPEKTTKKKSTKQPLEDRRPLQPRDTNAQNRLLLESPMDEWYVSRSLPVTPRSSSARKSWDADPRLSLQISSYKENYPNYKNTIMEEFNTLCELVNADALITPTRPKSRSRTRGKDRKRAPKKGSDGDKENKNTNVSGEKKAIKQKKDCSDNFNEKHRRVPISCPRSREERPKKPVLVPVAVFSSETRPKLTTNRASPSQKSDGITGSSKVVHKNKRWWSWGRQEWNYLKSILQHAGFRRSSSIATAKWYSHSRPLDPIIFHKVELTQPEQHREHGPLKHRCNRKLVFHLVNEALRDLIRPHINTRPWLSTFSPQLRRRSQIIPRGSELLRRLWAKIGGDANGPICYDEKYIDKVASKDISEEEQWHGFSQRSLCEEAERIVFEIERAIFGSLMQELMELLPMRERGVSLACPQQGCMC